MTNNVNSYNSHNVSDRDYVSNYVDIDAIPEPKMFTFGPKLWFLMSGFILIMALYY